MNTALENNEDMHDRCAANVAFELAIATGRLSANRAAHNYAGDFMFMGTHNGRDLFKHTMTRAYLA